MRGVLITFEGGEGCGKTTHTGLLAAYLRERGVRVRVTREPGGTALGERLRRVLLAPGDGEAAMDPWAEALLFAASRAQLVAEVIEPALAAGEVVLCDRFTDSTLAYQGYGLGMDVGMLCSLNRIATRGIAPDLTILLDVPADAGRDRAGARDEGDDRIAARGAAFHERVREGFLALAAQEPGRIRLVDARPGVDEVAARVREVVLPLLAARGLWTPGLPGGAP